MCLCQWHPPGLRNLWLCLKATDIRQRFLSTPIAMLAIFCHNNRFPSRKWKTGTYRSCSPFSLGHHEFPPCVVNKKCITLLNESLDIWAILIKFTKCGDRLHFKIYLATEKKDFYIIFSSYWFRRSTEIWQSPLAGWWALKSSIYVEARWS
jgi:hypothetical protein